VITVPGLGLNVALPYPVGTPARQRFVLKILGLNAALFFPMFLIRATIASLQILTSIIIKSLKNCKAFWSFAIVIVVAAGTSHSAEFPAGNGHCLPLDRQTNRCRIVDNHPCKALKQLSLSP